MDTFFISFKFNFLSFMIPTSLRRSHCSLENLSKLNNCMVLPSFSRLIKWLFYDLAQQDFSITSLIRGTYRREVSLWYDSDSFSNIVIIGLIETLQLHENTLKRWPMGRGITPIIDFRVLFVFLLMAVSEKRTSF